MGKKLIISDTDETDLFSNSEYLIVNKKDINRGDILAIVDSYEKDEIIFTVIDDTVPTALYYLIDTVDDFNINTKGKQGNNLYKLLLSIAPDREAELRYALMTHKDMLEVL